MSKMSLEHFVISHFRKANTTTGLSKKTAGANVKQLPPARDGAVWTWVRMITTVDESTQI